jgi:hypothetical protein
LNEQGSLKEQDFAAMRIAASQNLSSDAHVRDLLAPRHDSGRSYAETGGQVTRQIGFWKPSWGEGGITAKGDPALSAVIASEAKQSIVRQ